MNGEVPRAIGWVDEDKVLYKSGPLYQVEYARVVIDEAHNLRNPNTLISQFPLSLKADYRWVSLAIPQSLQTAPKFPCRL